MSRDDLATTAVAAALLLVGGLAWWLRAQPELRIEADALGTLPQAIDGWHGRPVPLEDTVESELRASFNLQRVYRHASGDIVWLYVGYYGTARGGRPEHTPRGCYTGAGWGIEATDTLVVDPERGLRVNEYRVERDGERRLVHFWFRSHRRTGMLGGLDQNLDRLLGRLLDGRADGALVRISTPLTGTDPTAARSRLRSFAATLDPLIAARWPRELPD